MEKTDSMHLAPALVPILALVLAIAATACTRQESPGAAQAPAAKAAPAATSTLAPGVKPGTHQDWCEEHQVQESLCTRCNPSLIPAFKATHDWCPEHGLPESQCLICNPGLKIVRPPLEEGGQ